MIRNEWPVSVLLQTWPQTMIVFKQWKLDCLGCEMAAFCTLEDVAREYNLDLPRFIQALETAVLTSQEREIP